jgi:SAM-dependent methyltransferase
VHSKLYYPQPSLFYASSATGKIERVDAESRYQGTLTEIAARWPAYLLGYGGGALLALLLIVAGSSRDLWGLAAFGLLLLLLVAYFLGADLWAVYQRYDIPGRRPVDLFFELGRVTATTRFVHVSMGLRRTPQQMSRRLTSGRVTALDVYNPQEAPGSALARARFAVRPAPPDPRLRWLEATIKLFPLPDRCTSLVTIEEAAGALWQHGDRLLLLREVYRILRPEGRLLLAQPVRTRKAWLVAGTGAMRLEPAAYWRRLLDEAGFNLLREMDVSGLVTYFVAERPATGEMQQLMLDLGV